MDLEGIRAQKLAFRSREQAEAYGRFVKKATQARHMSQAEVARLTGLTTETVSRIINGYVTQTAVMQVGLLANALGFSPNDLFEHVGWWRPPAEPRPGDMDAVPLEVRQIWRDMSLLNRDLSRDLLRAVREWQREHEGVNVVELRPEGAEPEAAYDREDNGDEG